jgi:Sulfatase
MSRPLILFSVAVCGVAGLTYVVNLLDRRPNRYVLIPAPARVLQGCVTLALMSSVAVVTVSTMSESMGFALRWTPSGQLFVRVLNALSDVDRDGYGLLRNPRDAAPLDAAIHPYAIDIPGNGVDEDGLAGDLPRAAASIPEWHPSALPWRNRPPVILFVLESVRADVVGSFFGGRRVTPVLDSLAAEGLQVHSAWSHNGFTSQSRYHILTGKLASGRGDDTILDDFKAHGYEVAYFSGQDDSFGDVGFLRHGVDTYYDARNDIDGRYTSSTTPGSLAVPLNMVEARIRNYLSGRRDGAPLFLYVNFHDTHYPYNHPGLENLIGGELLPASLISPARRVDLLRTYLNATANVDQAIGRVINAIEQQVRQRAAVIVIGDHGESLFDQGFLGHGYALNEAQTRIPLIVRGLPARITMPFGQADLRKVVNEALTRPDIDDRPSAVTERRSRVFQYLGRLESTSQIGWTMAEGSFTYDLRSDRVNVWDGSVKPSFLAGEPRRVFLELVHTWERLLLANAPAKDSSH